MTSREPNLETEWAELLDRILNSRPSKRSRRKMASDLVEAIEKGLLPTIFDVLAIEKPTGVRILKRRKAARNIERLLDIVSKSQSDGTMSAESLRELLDLSFAPMSKPSEGKDSIDFMIERLRASAQSPYLQKYFSGTDYVRYITCVNNLVKLIFDTGLGNMADAFVKEAQGTSDFLPFAQSLTRMLKGLKILSPQSGRIRKQIVEQCRTMYAELAAHYEKQIRLILGIHQITQTSKPADYEYYRKRSLSKNLKELARDPTLRILTAGFRREIRNALAHGSIILSLRNQTIDFVDRHSTTRLTFREFFEETRELNALLYAITQYNNLFNAEKFVLAKNTLSAPIQNHPVQVT